MVIAAGRQFVGLVMKGPRAAFPFRVSFASLIRMSNEPTLRGRLSKAVALR